MHGFRISFDCLNLLPHFSWIDHRGEFPVGESVEHLTEYTVQRAYHHIKRTCAQGNPARHANLIRDAAIAGSQPTNPDVTEAYRIAVVLKVERGFLDNALKRCRRRRFAADRDVILNQHAVV